MKEIYVISRASKIEGKLECHDPFLRFSYEDAIITAQENIAKDFGYPNWESFLSKRNPEIIDEACFYSIYDENCGHEESYRIRKFTVYTV